MDETIFFTGYCNTPGARVATGVSLERDEDDRYSRRIDVSVIGFPGERVRIKRYFDRTFYSIHPDGIDPARPPKEYWLLLNYVEFTCNRKESLMPLPPVFLSTCSECEEAVYRISFTLTDANLGSMPNQLEFEARPDLPELALRLLPGMRQTATERTFQAGMILPYGVRVDGTPHPGVTCIGSGPVDGVYSGTLHLLDSTANVPAGALLQQIYASTRTSPPVGTTGTIISAERLR